MELASLPFVAPRDFGKTRVTDYIDANSHNRTNNITNIFLGGRGGADMMPPMPGMPPLFDFPGGYGGCADSFELCGAGHGPRRGGHCCEAEYGNSKKGKYDGIANMIDAAGGAIAKIFSRLGMFGGCSVA